MESLNKTPNEYIRWVMRMEMIEKGLIKTKLSEEEEAILAIEYSFKKKRSNKEGTKGD